MNQVSDGSTLLPDHSSDPLLSLIVPMWNIEQYLRTFLDSLDSQDSGLSRVEIIFVDDGSPDDSARIAQSWLDSTRNRGRVVSSSNVGLSQARNLGLDCASGTWVSFPDPDDFVDPRYLELVMSFIDDPRSDGVDLIATEIRIFDEASGEVSNVHALRNSFSPSPEIVNLDLYPGRIKAQVSSSFFRRRTIRDAELRFDPRVVPYFEDGVFIGEYLLLSDAPKVMFLTGAHYLRRKRQDKVPMLSASWWRQEKYTEVPRFAWLFLLEKSVAKKNGVPVWLQNLVLLDMHRYFDMESRYRSPMRGHYAQTAETFFGLLLQTLSSIDAETIANYHITPLSPQTRAALLAHKHFASSTTSTIPGDDSCFWSVRISDEDESKNLVQIKYFFAGEQPQEHFEVNSVITQPTHQKIRSIKYFQHTVLFERILWIDRSDTIRIRLNGIQVELEQSSGFPQEIGGKKIPRNFKARVIRKLARLKLIRSRYDTAWVFLDRDSQAQDNAEHLYRWIRKNAPEVPSWFVLARSSPDWERLRSEGFRLVRFGSVSHKLLLLNCEHLISSHADKFVIQLLDPKIYGTPQWRFTFLQHGVTVNDMSRWMNSKPIDCMCTVGQPEYQSLMADYSPYVFTDKEITLTGFPRHDRLLALSNQTPAVERNLITVMPTWRSYLLSTTSSRGSNRTLRTGIEDSTFMASWRAFLSSDELLTAAAQNGKQVVLLAHPNMAPFIKPSWLPAEVKVQAYADGDIQTILARSCVAVTDYSSIVFDSALIGVPVVHYQFDKDEFYSRHTTYPGYFDYERDGFGPVTRTHLEAVRATIDAVNGGNQPTYVARATEFFAFRDQNSCQRTFEAILNLNRVD